MVHETPVLNCPKYLIVVQHGSAGFNIVCWQNLKWCHYLYAKAVKSSDAVALNSG